MQVKILGSAAGGGFPQWNCACSNCARLRAGTFRGSARTQAQLAVREPGKPWCLINASPDLRSQILADLDLAPQSAPRHSPIAAAVLTGADVDQVIGLLHLREFQPFQIYSTAAVETLLRGENSLFNALQQTQPQVDWKSIAPGKPASLKSSDGAELGLTVNASTIATKLPGYSERRSTADTSSTDTVIAVQIESDQRRKIFLRAGAPAPRRNLDRRLESMRRDPHRRHILVRRRTGAHARRRQIRARHGTYSDFRARRHARTPGENHAAAENLLSHQQYQPHP